MSHFSRAQERASAPRLVEQMSSGEESRHVGRGDDHKKYRDSLSPGHVKLANARERKKGLRRAFTKVIEVWNKGGSAKPPKRNTHPVKKGYSDEELEIDYEELFDFVVRGLVEDVTLQEELKKKLVSASIISQSGNRHAPPLKLGL